MDASCENRCIQESATGLKWRMMNGVDQSMKMYMMEEYICQSVGRLDEECANRHIICYGEYLSDKKIGLEFVRERMMVINQRFCCLSYMSSGTIETADGLADIYRQSYQEATGKKEMLALLDTEAKMFCLMQKQAISVSNGSIEDCVDYISEHMQEDLTLGILAERYRYHPAYFSKKFKDTFGCTFRTYLSQVRLEGAAQELRKTGYQLQEISDRYHFCNQSHFQNAFKKKYGMTPRMYRKHFLDKNRFISE